MEASRKKEEKRDAESITLGGKEWVWGETHERKSGAGNRGGGRKAKRKTTLAKICKERALFKRAKKNRIR